MTESTDTQSTPNEPASSSMTATLYKDASGYWKFCTFVLGFGFLVAVASNGSPKSASAHEPTNLLAFHQSQAAALKAADANQHLSIGGFDTIEGQPAFVIVNEQGQRIGILPMNSVSD